jgi:hypothetical protein
MSSIVSRMPGLQELLEGLALDVDQVRDVKDAGERGLLEVREIPSPARDLRGRSQGGALSSGR